MKNALNNFINDYKNFINYVKKSNNKIKAIIPNLLTFSRLFAPIFILISTILNNFSLSVIFAAAFSLTDAFDGYLARKWNVTSEFGKTLDPICDKFFILGIIIPFINNPIIIFTIILEGIIGLVNLNSKLKNNNPKSTYLGKGKTVLLSILLITLYLFKSIGLKIELLSPLITITNSVQLITAINYAYIDMKKDSIKEEKQILPDNEYYKDNENNNVSKIKQELIEYKHIKESLLEQKENHQEIEKEKRKHLS